MIICQSRRYLFIHLHKTGGTSVEAALAPSLAWNDLLLGSTAFGEQCNQHYRSRFGLGKHSSLEEVYRFCANSPQMQAYRVVSVVREPLERAVSLYNFIAGVLERIQGPLGLSLAELHRRRGELAPLHPQLEWPAARAFLEAQPNFDAFVASPALEHARGFASQVSQLRHQGAVPADLTWITTAQLSSQLGQPGGLLAELAGTAVSLEHLNASSQRLISPEAVEPRTRQRIRERFAADYEQFGFPT